MEAIFILIFLDDKTPKITIFLTMSDIEDFDLDGIDIANEEFTPINIQKQIEVPTLTEMEHMDEMEELKAQEEYEEFLKQFKKDE